jgi:hypothetical protein
MRKTKARQRNENSHQLRQQAQKADKQVILRACNQIFLLFMGHWGLNGVISKCFASLVENAFWSYHYSLQFSTFIV